MRSSAASALNKISAEAKTVVPQLVVVDKVEFELNTDRIGADYRNMYISERDEDLCKQICAFDEQCQAFTLVRQGVEGDRDRCYFKNHVASSSLERRPEF